MGRWQNFFASNFSNYIHFEQLNLNALMNGIRSDQVLAEQNLLNIMKPKIIELQQKLFNTEKSNKYNLEQYNRWKNISEERETTITTLQTQNNALKSEMTKIKAKHGITIMQRTMHINNRN